ncbi:hypothetical protein ACVMB1_000707 [Bradyrhizobium sp. USDA 4504]
MTGVGFDETARSALADRAKDISDFVTFRSQPGTFLPSNQFVNRRLHKPIGFDFQDTVVRDVLSCSRCRMRAMTV